MSDESRPRVAPAMPWHLRVVGQAAGTLAALLGLITSAGWWFDVPGLVQLHPSLSPMVLNTALCFLLAGLGLLALALGRTFGSLCCGMAIAVLAALALTAYLLSAGLRIDQLIAIGGRFADPREPRRPLQMAPNTATAFLLVGVALCLAGGRARAARAFAAGGAAGIAVLSLSLVALVGYVFGVEPAFGWGRMIAMSPQSAVGLAIVGSAILLLVGRPDLMVGPQRKQWLALLAGCASATTTLLLWQALAADQGHTFQERLDAQTSSLKSALSGSLKLHVDALIRLGHRWERRVGPRREDWEEDAFAYLNDFSGFEAVEWTSLDGSLRWAVPRRAGTTVLEAGRLSEDRRRSIFEEAAHAGTPATIAGPVGLPDGRTFLVLVPLTSEGSVAGFIVAALHGRRFLDFVVEAESRSDHRIALSLAGEPLGAIAPESALSKTSRSESTFLLLGRKWSVEVVPTASWASHQQSALPWGALFGGLVFSGLLGWSVLKTGEARLSNATLERANRAADAQAKAVALINDQFVTEVAERRGAEQERDQFFSLSIDMLCISSADGYFKRLNPAFEQTLGYTVDELTGRPFLDFLHPDDVAVTLAEVDRQVVGGIATLHFQNRYRHKDGTYRWLAWKSMPDVKTGMMYALARDVTDEKVAEADRERLIAELKSTLAEVRTLSIQLETLSLTDVLTGVPNRRAFERALDQEIALARRHGHSLGLLALDIDHFKQVNDVYGHEGGDEVLRSFARTVVAALRKGDSLYRTGGEEFAVVLPFADLVPLVKAAERIVAAVASATVTVGERIVPITTSAGGASLQPGGDGRDIWARADAALYEAKRAGRNRVCLSQPPGLVAAKGRAV